MAIEVQELVVGGAYSPTPRDGVGHTVTTFGGVECISFTPKESVPGHLLIYAGDGPRGLAASVGVIGPLALAAGCELIAPLYRCPPKHSVHQAVADVLAVYQDAISPGKVVPPEAPRRCVLSGEMRGAAIALAVTAVARELELRAPEGLILLTQAPALGAPDERYLRCGATDPIVWQSFSRVCPDFESWANAEARLFADLASSCPVLLQTVTNVQTASATSAGVVSLAGQIAIGRKELPVRLGELVEWLWARDSATTGRWR